MLLDDPIAVECLNEYYFGENAQTKKIENDFANIINEARKYKKTPTPDDKKVVKKFSKLFDQLNKDVSKFIGMPAQVLVDTNDTYSYNAYTYLIEYKKSYVKNKTNYTLTQNGLKVNPNAAKSNFIIVFTWKFIFKPIFTPREITATILHEIGHNFSEGSLPPTSGLDALKMALTIANRTKIDTYMHREPSDEGVDDFKDLILQAIKTIPNLFMYGIDCIGDLAKSLQFMVAKIIPTPDADRYMDEKFADSYATQLGYGKDLASALNKMDKVVDKDFGKNNPIIATMLGFYTLAFLIIFDEHPSTFARIKSQIASLQYELDSDKTLPPQMKRKIQKDINDLNVLMKQRLTIEKSDKYLMATKMYDNAMDKLFDTGDIFGTLIRGAFRFKDIDFNMREH